MGCEAIDPPAFLFAPDKSDECWSVLFPAVDNQPSPPGLVTISGPEDGMFPELGLPNQPRHLLQPPDNNHCNQRRQYHRTWTKASQYEKVIEKYRHKNIICRYFFAGTFTIAEISATINIMRKKCSPVQMMCWKWCVVLATVLMFSGGCLTCDLLMTFLRWVRN